MKRVEQHGSSERTSGAVAITKVRIAHSIGETAQQPDFRTCKSGTLILINAEMLGSTTFGNSRSCEPSSKRL